MLTINYDTTKLYSHTYSGYSVYPVSWLLSIVPPQQQDLLHTACKKVIVKRL